jgi:hypothetical protein
MSSIFRGKIVHCLTGQCKLPKIFHLVYGAHRMENEFWLIEDGGERLEGKGI